MIEAILVYYTAVWVVLFCLQLYIRDKNDIEFDYKQMIVRATLHAIPITAATVFMSAFAF